jgi:hypothetical protein
MLTKNYSILLKAKEEQKYRSNFLLKEGTIVNVLDIIKNKGSTYLKIPMKNNDLTFGYIKLKDDEGNNNIKNIEEKKEEKKIDKPKREICHSIRLGDAEKIGTEKKKKSQEELNCEKRSKEFLDKIAIPLIVDKSLNQKNEEEQDSTDISTTLDNEANNPFYEKENNPFNDEEGFITEKSKEKTDLKTKEKNNGNKNKTKDENLSTKFCPGNGSNISPNSIPVLKGILAGGYLLNKGFKEQGGNYGGCPSLEPKYEKGIQVIIRAFDLRENIRKYLDKELKVLVDIDIGHVFIRYYDKSKGIDKIIESIKIGSINEIKFSDFKKEDLMKFKYYKILMDEELFDGKDYDYDDIKNILIKKYKDKNGVINKGKYNLLFNNCFDTVEEVLNYFGKSHDAIKKYRKKCKKIIKRYEECRGDDDWPY